MALFVVEELGEEFRCSIELPAPMREALRRQAARDAEAPSTRSAFKERFTTALLHAMEGAVDWDLRPPTEAQVDYALTICRELGAPMPPDALRYRGAMHEYISTNVDAYRARRRSRVATAYKGAFE